MINLIFIGKDFYGKSHTVMSNLYQVHPDGSLTRYDYGFMGIDLGEGKEICIRQANDEQMKWAYQKLGKILANK